MPVLLDWVLIGKCAKVFNGCLVIGSGGGYLVDKETEVDGRLINYDLGLPFAASFVPEDAFIT